MLAKSGTKTEVQKDAPQDGGLGADVCEEVPVQITLNQKELATLLCTPTALQELAVGWLYAEGLIEGLDEILSLGACPEMRSIAVVVSKEREVATSEWQRVITSGCGGGASGVLAQSQDLPSVASTFCLEVDKLPLLMKQMIARSELYQTVGGMHSAALANGEGIIVHFEDVGRHNAVDKVIGRGLMTGIDFGQSVILCTGRISSEMAYKAGRAGIPIAASRSIPTSLALEIADQMGVSIVGRVLSKRRQVYTHPERIL